MLGRLSSFAGVRRPRKPRKFKWCRALSPSRSRESARSNCGGGGVAVGGGNESREDANDSLLPSLPNLKDSYRAKASLSWALGSSGSGSGSSSDGGVSSLTDEVDAIESLAGAAGGGRRPRLAFLDFGGLGGGFLSDFTIKPAASSTRWRSFSRASRPAPGSSIPSDSDSDDTEKYSSSELAERSSCSLAPVSMARSAFS